MPRFVTDDDRRMLGDDVIHSVSNVALESLAPHIQQLAIENQRLQNANQSLNQRVSRDAVLRALDAAFGSRDAWEKINHSDAFKQWLAHSHSLSGQVKHGHLLSAFEMGSADRVIAIFRQFLAEGQGAGQTQHAPGRAQRGRQAAASGMTIGQAIQAFYDDVRKGRWPDEQKRAIEERRLHNLAHGRRA